MFDRIFGQVNRLEKGLDAAWMRQEVISHNIANADTPGYKRQFVEFEDMFRKALEGHDVSALKTTRSRHMVPGSSDVGLAVVREMWTTMRMDENNVDPDREMTDLAQNTIMYNALTGQVNSEFNRLRMVITGR